MGFPKDRLNPFRYPYNLQFLEVSSENESITKVFTSVTTFFCVMNLSKFIYNNQDQLKIKY